MDRTAPAVPISGFRHLATSPRWEEMGRSAALDPAEAVEEGAPAISTSAIQAAEGEEEAAVVVDSAVEQALALREAVGPSASTSKTRVQA